MPEGQQQTIRAAGGHYLLGVKGNQASLLLVVEGGVRRRRGGRARRGAS
ncbi:MAG: hypothetical protein U0840_20515 [Gemmataceae bacterium]